MAYADIRSEAVVLLLLIYNLLLLPMVLGVQCSVFGPCSMLYYVVRSVLSSFAIILMDNRQLVI